MKANSSSVALVVWILLKPFQTSNFVKYQSFEPVEDFPDKGERIGFLLHNLIKPLIVNNRTEFVIFLLEEEWRSPGGMSTVDVSSCQVLVDPLPEFCMVGLWHGIELGSVGHCSLH